MRLKRELEVEPSQAPLRVGSALEQASLDVTPLPPIAATTAAGPGGGRWRKAWIGVAAGAVVIGFGGLAMLAGRGGGGARPAPMPVLAVGLVHDYERRDTAGVAQALRDMLATNLARAPGLTVVSGARTLEVFARIAAQGDSAAAMLRAARETGATELIEGAL